MSWTISSIPLPGVMTNTSHKISRQNQILGSREDDIQEGVLMCMLLCEIVCVWVFVNCRIIGKSVKVCNMDNFFRLKSNALTKS